MRDSNTPPLWLQVPEPHDLVMRFGTAVDVPAFGGRLEVDWSPGERVTSVGGLVYFATFLKETGRFDRLCEDFPIKPGRPSHNYHSFFIGKARIALGVDVRPGKQHFGRCGMKRLWALVDTLPPDRRPALLRGDVGYGNDATMCEAEARGIPYLFKIKRSRNIQKLFRALSGGNGWKDCGSGWEALEHRIKLDGWQWGRRVLFIRRPAEKKVEPVKPKKPGRKPKSPRKSAALVPTAPAVVKQAELDFVKDVRGREWDYCVLVTNDEKMDAWALSQLYRDRGDCENNFDSGRKRIIHLTSTHTESELIQRALGTVAAFFRWLKSTAEHLDEKTRWYVVLRCAFRKLLMPEQPLGAVIPIQ